VALPFVLLRLLWRSRKAPAYRKRWAERFGCIKVPKEIQGGIWVHVVSVGEVLAAAPLMQELIKRYPNKRLIVTTMTPTGSDRVKASLPKEVFHVYTPYDFPDAVERFLNKTQPCLAIFMETELWPNILRSCRKRHIPTLLANARLSQKSAKGYGRFGSFTKEMLNDLSMLAVQAEPDAERFRQLGVNNASIQVTGSVKFDMTIPESLHTEAKALRQQLGQDRPIWIAASTHEGEDKIILEAFKTIKQSLASSLLILVPRHPERFAKVGALCEQAGFQVTKRSEKIPATAETDIFLGDTMGELRIFLGASDVAFIGGSLIERGGHNMLEAGAFSLPVLSGPHIFNFKEVTRLLNEAEALTTVHNAEELAEEVIKLLNNKELRNTLGQRAQQVVDNNRGALEKHLQLIDALLCSDR
jgi:3-deoxy-D-manno-octulosonic-acid transferase